MNRPPILPVEPLAGPTTPAAEAWSRVRALNERLRLAARIQTIATTLDAPGVVREIDAFIVEVGVRVELATGHARRVSNAGGSR